MNEYVILVIDDEESQLKVLAGYLRKKQFQVFEACQAEEGLNLIRDYPIDVVLTDMRMPGMTGIELLKQIKCLHPEIGVLVMTAYGSVDDAVTAMKEGAEDYIQKPIDLDQLDMVINKLFERRRLLSENRELKQMLQSKYHFDQLISGSGKIEEVLNVAARVSKSQATVLLSGESGTGKEVIARAIHLAGERKEAPFVAVNVAAVPENLVASEFFGHEKGSFTGADRQRKGRFEMADRGTLFIDEIGDIPVSEQVKLLRVLQERAFERVGGSETIRVDIRIIAATNRNLEDLIQKGLFREDLYYRLNVVTISIPPLRERREEIPLFIDHFLRKYREEEKKEIDSVSKEAMNALLKYDFPGNVRELENIIHRGVVLARSEIITTDDLPPHLGHLKSEMKNLPKGSLVDQVEWFEKEMIQKALSESKGNQSEAARFLGITERNIRYKMKKYGMK